MELKRPPLTAYRPEKDVFCYIYMSLVTFSVGRTETSIIKGPQNVHRHFLSPEDRPLHERPGAAKDDLKALQVVESVSRDQVSRRTTNAAVE